MVGIEKSHEDFFDRRELNLRRRVQWDWSLKKFERKGRYESLSLDTPKIVDEQYHFGLTSSLLRCL
jgi:hypothetical protein